MTTYSNIYAAVFQMRTQDMRRYMAAWDKRHPGKESHWISVITPYVSPPGFLFSAPLTNPLLSLLDIIAKLNGFTLPPIQEYAPVVECMECGLAVIYLKDDTICLKCYGNWVDADLDETE